MAFSHDRYINACVDRFIDDANYTKIRSKYPIVLYRNASGENVTINYLVNLQVLKYESPFFDINSGFTQLFFNIGGRLALMRCKLMYTSDFILKSNFIKIILYREWRHAKKRKIVYLTRKNCIEN